MREEVIIGNGNLNQTYSSVHNIQEAHKIASGKGIKVGIIDRFFNIDIEKLTDYVLAHNEGKFIKNGNQIPFVSFSSMSPVLAGFVCLLREINPNITAKECKNILINKICDHFKIPRGCF